MNEGITKLLDSGASAEEVSPHNISEPADYYDVLTTDSAFLDSFDNCTEWFNNLNSFQKEQLGLSDDLNSTTKVRRTKTLSPMHFWTHFPKMIMSNHFCSHGST